MLYIELIPFFKERLKELFHKDSLDSYRVRHHNTLSVIKELRSLIIGWQNKNIKQAQTVQYCVDEVKDAINKDEVFDFSVCSKKQFLLVLEEYEKYLQSKKERNASENSKLIFLLNKFIETNQSNYLTNLWNKIQETLYQEGSLEENLFIPEISKLESLIVSLAREILNRGHSKKIAFLITNKYTTEGNTLEEFVKFRSMLEGSSSKTFKVIFSLFIQNTPDPVISNFLSELNIDSIDNFIGNKARLNNFISSAPNRRFFVVELENTDPYLAIKDAKNQLFGELDAINIGMWRMKVTIDDSALVIESPGKDDQTISFHPTQFIFDGTYPQDIATANKYRTLLQKIRSNPLIDESVKVRLDSALRHLRIANTDSEIEQRFINYWIALEFIFSSPLIEENTFNRLKINLTNILSACYVERNLRYLEKILRQKHFLRSNEKINSENIQNLIDTQTNILLKYRLSKFKSRLFGHSDKRENYIKFHRKNLESHLSRIYHLRNELIHEAAINHSIEDLTSNLKYYLVFLLNQMITYFVSVQDTGLKQKIKIDDFFYEYQLIMDNFEESWSLEKMRNVPYHNDLIKS